MMIFVQLLLFTCACALGAADEVPPYGDIVDSIYAALEILNDNILSMDGNVPLLNDPRRHYAEIIHVVYDEAKHERDCLYHDYYKDYQKNINLSAPFAIANPQSVVDGTKTVISDIINSVDEVLQLVNASAHNDKAVDDKIEKNVEKYGLSREVFLATGLFATQLNKDHKDYFAASSQNLSAHNFVITGAEKLELIVMALNNLYEKLHPNIC